jgi:hypothetical protein
VEKKMKRALAILFFLTATLSFSDNYWSGKKFSYQTINVISDSEIIKGTITFVNDNTVLIQIGDNKAETTEYDYFWDQQLSVMTVGKTGFFFKKIREGIWHMTKIDEGATIESFSLSEIKK